MKQFLLSYSSKLLFSLLEYLSLTLYYLKTGFLSANQSEDIFKLTITFQMIVSAREEIWSAISNNK